MYKQRRRARTIARRKRTAKVGAVVVAAALVALYLTHVGPFAGGRAARTTESRTGHNPSSPAGGPGAAVPSIEAGVEPWSLAAPSSRQAVVPDGPGLVVLGGLTTSGASSPAVATVDPATGTIASAGTLASGVHDAAAAPIAGRAVVFGGGDPTTVAGVQSIALPPVALPSVALPSVPPGGSATGEVGGSLPQPRSDLATATISVTGPGGGRARATVTTTYVVGGYDGTNYLPGVLATTDGQRFTQVARLAVPVRYPAVTALGDRIYAFGGETPSTGTAVAATDDIQMVDPATGAATVVGHLPAPVYGAAAFLIGGTIYVAGGQAPGGATQTGIEAFVPPPPRSGAARVLAAGLLPQAVAFAGYATLGQGKSAIGYLVGGEVASQSGAGAGGLAGGALSTVISLRPSGYGGAAGTAGAGSPYQGTLLIADRGNNRLLALDPARNVVWLYPSATMPPPQGGFYFPDDAFFFDKGAGIISNQEENHTIVEIGYPSGKILWQYGHPGVAGSRPGYLNQPDDAYLLKSGVVTVADASNNRILFLSPQGAVVGQIGNGTDVHKPPVSIAYPNGDTPLADGNVLVSEIDGSWVDEYTQTGSLVWSAHFPSVNYPSDPQQLGPDSYLMTDYDPPAEGRVLEFNREGQVTWRYDATSGDARLKKPSLAEQLPDGLIMVNDDYRDRVVVIDPATNSIVWQYGLTDVAGTGPGLLSIPDGFDLLEADGTTPTHPQTG